MPLTRKAFEIKLPDGFKTTAEHAAVANRELEDVPRHSTENAGKTSVSPRDVDGAGAASNFREETERRAAELPKIISAVAPSGGTPNDIPPAHGEARTHADAGRGRDAQGAGTAFEHREISEADLGGVHAQTRVVEHRLTRQKGATAEHLSGIHDAMARLLNLTETHVADADGKLEAVQQRLGELEMRFGTNRNCQ
jgi:hypothetical protein